MGNRGKNSQSDIAREKEFLIPTFSDMSLYPPKEALNKPSWIPFETGASILDSFLIT
ncbi:MAG: hypothetical protein ACETWK_10005 [Candidatus Aminicenantaceae bacterium]